MTIPERIEAPALADYLAVMSRAIFQAGLSWKLIDSKWDAYMRLFDGFDPVLVAAYGEGDVERILADGGVVRTRKKIVATIENARTLLQIERTGGLQPYLRSFATYAELAADLRQRFKFLGELSVYYFLFRVGEAVPRFEEWERSIPGDHPRMREMIALARERGWTGETGGSAARMYRSEDAMAATKRKSTAKSKASRQPVAATRKTSSPPRGRLKKSAARKAGSQKSASKKTTAKKTTSKKTTAKKTTAKKTTKKKNTAKKSLPGAGTRKYGPKASASVANAMDEMKRGKLRSGGSGKKVANREQAIAIGLSEARRSGAKVPPPPKRGKK